MQCLCGQILVSALPYRRTKKEEAQEKATRLSSISVPYQKKNGSHARKAKGEETVVLSSSEFLDEINRIYAISPGEKQGKRAHIRGSRFDTGYQTLKQTKKMVRH